MLAFGLNKKLCNDFLKKQAVIGNLDEGECQPGRRGLGFRTEVGCTWDPRPNQRIIPILLRNGTLNVLACLSAWDTCPSIWKPSSAR